MYLLYVVVFLLLPHSPKHWVTSIASYAVALPASACKRIEPNGDGSFAAEFKFYTGELVVADRASISFGNIFFHTTF